MSLGFPTNPNVGDTYTIGTQTYVWTGKAWAIQVQAAQNPSSITVGTGTSTILIGSGAITINGSEVVTTSTLEILNTGTLQTVTSRGSTTNRPITITNSSNSFSTLSGALVVTGGAGIGGSVYAKSLFDSGKRVVTSVIATGSTYIGIESLVSNGTATSFTINNLGVQTLTAGTDTAVSSNTGTITVWNTSTLQSITNRGATTTNSISIASTVLSTSTTTGALIIAGGVGIGRDVYAGGSGYFGGVVTATTFYGNLTGLATTSTNLAGGPIGSVPYQLSPGVTSFIPITSNVGWVLTSNGTTATWASPSVGTVNSSTTATNIAGFSSSQVLFQFNPGITTATSGLTYNLNNSQLRAANLLVNGITTSSGKLVANSGAITTGTNTGALVVSGGAGISGSVNIGGVVTAGLQDAATGVPIYTFSGGNTTFATYTSPVITGTGQVTIDSWSTSSYRTARYVIQIIDSGKVHVTEMTVFTDWTNIYMNQYGISTNQGELGLFNANSTSTVGSVTLTFTPSPAASAMTIKVSRMGITT